MSWNHGRGGYIFGNVELTDARIPRYKKIEITATPTGSEQDTTFDLPVPCVVTNVFVNVTTAEATGGTKTMDVGLLSSETNGDANGFLAAVSCAATGLVGGSLASGGQTLGALLYADESGAGVLVPEKHMVTGSNAKSVTYTAGSADWAEFRGELWIEYVDLS